MVMGYYFTDIEHPKHEQAHMRLLVKEQEQGLLML